jgi:hypothetical protein
MSSPNKEKKLDGGFDVLLLEPLLALPDPGSVGR